MKESVGSIALYNFIIVYIILVFAILSAMLSYNKAFKINSRILGTIEKYEGWNSASYRESNRYLNSIGYRQKSPNFSCPRYDESTAVQQDQRSIYQYCVYLDLTESPETTGYYRYNVITYIYVDLPLVGDFSLPIKGKTNRIYKFTDSQELNEN